MKKWEQIMEEGYRDVRQLKGFLRLPEQKLQELEKIQSAFPMMINLYYASLIDWSDPEDPIRRMCVPQLSEAEGGGSFDTSGEKSNTVMAGLQHKYRQTALILSTNQCAMYCRHCFRKRLVGLSEEEIARRLEDFFAYIRRHEEITNVLISGGDALMNSNGTIERYLAGLCQIAHLDLIRLGTRTLVTLPQRITTDPELTDILAAYSTKKQLYVVTQFNHPREITSEAAAAVRRLLTLGIPIRNQTVLLRGVNDQADTLAALLRGLTAMGVLPYYVFQCRPVTGVMSHFQVPLREGYEIIEQAKRMQDGQGKGFRFVLSHPTGKIEILGPVDSQDMLFKYHQAKSEADQGRIFRRSVRKGQCWL